MNIAKFCKQHVSYWGLSANAGYGDRTFSAPVEHLARWDDSQKVVLTKDGREITSSASVMTKSVPVMGSYYKQADVNTLDSSDVNPVNVDGARMVIMVEQILDVKCRLLGYMAYLS